jgi:hypothetical protein
MSLTVQCLNCAQRFNAPEDVRGQRLACPACGAPINVPPPVANAPMLRPGGVMEMLKDEPTSKAGAIESAKGFDRNTVSALGISERKLFTGRRLPLPGSEEARRRPQSGWEVILSHKLVLVTFIASMGAFLVALMRFNSPAGGAIAAVVGICIALGAWRSQALAGSDRKVADDWRVFQRWLTYAVLIVGATAATWLAGMRLYTIFAQVVPEIGLTSRVWINIAAAAIGWILLGIYLLMFWVKSSHQGFFQPAAWTYIWCFVLLVAAATLGQFASAAFRSPADLIQSVHAGANEAVESGQSDVAK